MQQATQAISPCTPRQLQVLTLIAAGYTYKQAAHELGMGTKAISKILERAKKRVAAQDLMPLIVALAMQGFITVAPMSLKPQLKDGRGRQKSC